MIKGRMIVGPATVSGGATERKGQNDWGQNDGETDDGVWRGDGQERAE